ncbi:MAG: DNA-directed RNA polymerase subunit delta [Peptococcaceae bacterium]|nr:DNA-directed RNA polymerase subunit delta [Peptococcaceae bacterium]
MSQNTIFPLDKKMSEVDLAYNILKSKNEPMYYRTLIDEVFVIKPPPGDPVLAIAGVHTQINLDTRFIYLGQGQWGLKCWVPAKPHKKIPSITLLNRSVVYDDQDKEHDDAEKDTNYFVDEEEHDSQDNWEE